MINIEEGHVFSEGGPDRQKYRLTRTLRYGDKLSAWDLVPVNKYTKWLESGDPFPQWVLDQVEELRTSMKFYLGGQTYDAANLSIETYEGRYKDDYYSTKVYSPLEFIHRLVEAAKRQGATDIQDKVKRALDLK